MDALSSSSSVPPLKLVVVAIVEGRGQARGEVGMSCMGIGSANLILSEFSDDQNYTKMLSKLNILQPSKILMTSGACASSGQNRMFEQLKKEFNLVEVIPIQRKLFNGEKGFTKIRQLVNEEFQSVPLIVAKKYYLLAAAAALFEYLEVVRSVNFFPKTLKMEFQGSGQTAQIDTATVKHLELLVNNNDPKSCHTLLGILDTCKTPMGSRLLRSNILQPPFNESLIVQRLECVEELKSNPELLYSLQAHLSSLSVDVDHVISNLVQVPRYENDVIKEQRANFILALKHVLQRLPGFATTLKPLTQSYFQLMSSEFEMPIFTRINQKIHSIINEESQVQKGAANMGLQRTFAVKANINEMLDVARKVYCEIIGDINDYVLNLSRECGHPLQICENPKNGLFMQFKLHDVENVAKLVLPKIFLKVRRLKNTISFTTEELLITDQRVKVIRREILNLSDIVIAQLIEDIRQEIGSLYKISEAIANLDVLHSFAMYATLFKSVRPSFSKFATAVVKGRHPILDSISFEPPVANDTFLSSDVNLNVITGPNMSGKTTYLKQVALLQIMAQIGSFVPAEAAMFRIADSIFSRLSTDDNIEGNASSFAVEMNEMNYILRNSTGSSLVIIDELGRATSIEEGIAMSWAMIESLLTAETFVLFATHFLTLTKMESIHFNVLNYKMETVEKVLHTETLTQQCGVKVDNNPSSSSLKYIHVYSRGVTEVEHYGLKLAKMSALPTPVTDDAITVAQKIILSRERQRAPARRLEFTKIFYLLGSNLAAASNHSVLTSSPERLRKYLKLLKAQFQNPER
ncbi:unnamed protein product [Allacma fusca]|uniref:DNA mismatch repair proteins mutS family domain-containing protein n=1 Tax=Allacma fusca TaxID=39272 RepID=A0A8J2PB49_9HEXA|nr:unnamed protein product [Allacma fusca]